MKTLHAGLALIFFGLTWPSFADQAAFDTAFEKLLVDSSKAVSGSKKQKIAVLNFSDLNGQTTVFGKFLAEQLTVGMVSASSGYTVVDRANLKTILDEHKLTEQGLVEPENAKKLGEFSGVDAIVIGTTTSVASGYFVTIKVISTDKAEICGAVRGRLPKSPDFDAGEVPVTQSTPKASDAKGSSEPARKKETEPSKEEILQAKIREITGVIPEAPKIARRAAVVYSDGRIVEGIWNEIESYSSKAKVLVLYNAKTGGMMELENKNVDEITPPFSGAVIERVQYIHDNRSKEGCLYAAVSMSK